MPLPESPLTVPSVALRSARAKSVVDSLVVKVSVDDKPALTVVGDAEIEDMVGRVVSIVTDSAEEALLVTPFCVCVAVIDHTPSESVPSVQEPDDSAQVTVVELRVAVTVPVAPALIPDTVIVGVESDVMRSDALVPVSLDAASTGVFGALIEVVIGTSMKICRLKLDRTLIVFCTNVQSE